MSDIAIKVENLSKIYRLGEIGTGTISRDMERWFRTRILKQEDPFLKIGETNDRANKGASDVVYSLQDINFEINQGDAVGIIGRNGAGKSTLLKILSRVTTPSTGKINIKGRVASLLEVGTGFHPELTGRENIYLNGAILGMRKREIDRKLEEIIDFSGVERYIDTPVKRYSSGMYVRLAFAVAAHLESEILIVDEVLAVGDAEFQKKCLGKMGEVSKGEGRTVLFVSHNMGAVQNLCNKGILLENGKVTDNGLALKVVQKYQQNQKLKNYWTQNAFPIKRSSITSVEVSVFGRQPNLQLKVITELFIKEGMNKKAFLAFYIGNQDSLPIMEAIPEYNLIDCSQNNQSHTTEVMIDLTGIIPGTYTLGIWFGVEHIIELDWQKEIVQFEITDFPDLSRTVEYPNHAGFIVPKSFIVAVR